MAALDVRDSAAGGASSRGGGASSVRFTMRSSHTPASPESTHAETTAAMPSTAKWEPLASSATLGDCTSTMPMKRMPSASHLATRRA